jgi:ligand-binding sensor domain-containing protein
MKPFVKLFALFSMAVFLSSCKQKQPYAPPDIFRSETKDSVSSYGPTRMVRNVKQARNGDILIASYTGVWRYNGKLFTNITSAISSPSFWDVLEDRKGNLWFGTKDSGVYCYNGKSFLHYTTRQGLASNMALHLYEDKSGNIIEDKTGKLWFGTRGDACFYDGKTFTVFKNKDGKPFYNVWAIIEDQKGNVWFGATIINDRRSNGKGGDTLFASEGLWRYDGSTYTKVSQKRAYAIVEDKNGNIWTTGADEPPRIGQVWSLSRYDQKSLYNKKPTVTEIKSQSGMLLGILENAKGNIWFGSGGGVYRYDGKTITDFKSKEGQK